MTFLWKKSFFLSQSCFYLIKEEKQSNKAVLYFVIMRNYNMFQPVQHNQTAVTFYLRYHRWWMIRQKLTEKLKKNLLA